MTVERIAKLLNMAERAKNAEEAAAFFAKAQAIATKHEIDLAQARLRQPEAARDKPVRKRLDVGRPRQQANRHFLRLLVALARSNGCEIGLYQNNTAAELFGLPTDIATVERMFAAIAPQMLRLGEEHLALGDWRGQAVVDIRTGRPRAITRQAARASFYEGFTAKLAQRIRDAASAARESAGSAHDSPGAELALRAKEVEVRRLAERHLGRGTWRGDRTQGPIALESYLAGDRAASSVRLGRGPELGQRGGLAARGSG